MYAVFETGGKQYKASKGDVLWVEKLSAEPGKPVSFDALVVSDGDNVQVGTPTIKGVSVKAKVVGHGKAKKVVVFKYKAKKNYRRKQGHRQPYTKIEITGFTGVKADKSIAEAMEAKKTRSDGKSQSGGEGSKSGAESESRNGVQAQGSAEGESRSGVPSPRQRRRRKPKRRPSPRQRRRRKPKRRPSPKQRRRRKPKQRQSPRQRRRRKPKQRQSPRQRRRRKPRQRQSPRRNRKQKRRRKPKNSLNPQGKRGA